MSSLYFRLFKISLKKTCYMNLIQTGGMQLAWKVHEGE